MPRLLSLGVALGLAASALALTDGPNADGWRQLSLGAGRVEALRAEVERALEAALKEHVRQITLGLSEPRLMRRGEEFQLCFERGEVGLAGLDVAGIAVSGKIVFEDLKLDYSALGIGKFKLVSVPRILPDLSTTLDELQAFLARQGLKDTFIRADEATGELEFGGRRPTRIFLSKVNPLVTIRGRFQVQENRVSFAISKLEVRDAGGMVADEVERRVRSIAARTVDLSEVLAGLEVERIRVGGGAIRVESSQGVFFAQKFAAAEIQAGD